MRHWIGPALIDHARESGPLGPDDPDCIGLALKNRLRGSDDSRREQWRLVRRHVGYNRFLLTILLAAAEQMVIYARDTSDGAVPASGFIRSTIDQIRSMGRDQREDVVLQSVIACYRRLHVIGDPDRDTELHHLLCVIWAWWARH